MPKPKDKEKFPLWAKPETLKSVKEHYRSDNCKSQSEFIEKTGLILSRFACRTVRKYSAKHGMRRLLSFCRTAIRMHNARKANCTQR